jgi:hypothetical protein
VIIDGAAGGETNRRHDVTFTVDVAPRKRLCTFFYMIFPKRKHRLYRCPADFSYEKPIEILRTLLLMHDGISLGKILPKQVGYFGT